MASFSAMLKLPASRVKQLKALALVRNTTMSDLIGELINDAVQRGEIPDETPGLSFAPHGTGLAIQFNDQTFRMHFHRAEEFYSALERIARSGGKWKVANLRQSVEIHRVGTSTVLELLEGDRSIVRKSLTQSVVRDVRRQIRAIFPSDFGEN